MKEVFLGGWVTSLLVLVALCSIGGATEQVGVFIGIMCILAAFGGFVRSMMLYSNSGKKGIDWKALGCYGIGAAVSVAVPAVMMMLMIVLLYIKDKNYIIGPIKWNVML